MLLAGRAAELAVYGVPSSGAANDLERASQLAYRMVTEFGFSDEYGPLNCSAIGPSRPRWRKAQLRKRVRC